MQGRNVAQSKRLKVLERELTLPRLQRWSSTLKKPIFGLDKGDNLTESNSFYLRYCREHGIDPHPARYPAELPEFFIRMLTDPNDFVVDPFAGSCVTGEVCERLKRRWLCGELCEEYLQGALGRFKQKHIAESNKLSHPGVLWNDLEKPDKDDESNYYKLPRPGTLWNDTSDSPLANDGGKKRQKATDKHKNKRTSEKP